MFQYIMNGVLSMSQSVNQLMSTNVVTVSPQQSIQEAAVLMKQQNVGSIPVVENGQICGIITDRDITLRSTAAGTASSVPVRDCMSTNLTVASPTMDVHEVAQLMAQHQVRRLPVVDNGQVVGMVAIGDLANEAIYQNEAGEALSNISLPSNEMK
ncbi:CBS domain-containing protein [Halalkalibacter nanhaiisediminis]|uniref:CBS domain-containing protein n=2 Tax=Halalkalibacter nanhaiisediminis TaxID=688079 RepID=A0A562QR62_9BACI|nr:CBS domain-containing protein [Halalkalibacter nanhaiisediminis]